MRSWDGVGFAAGAPPAGRAAAGELAAAAAAGPGLPVGRAVALPPAAGAGGGLRRPERGLLLEFGFEFVPGLVAVGRVPGELAAQPGHCLRDPGGGVIAGVGAGDVAEDVVEERHRVQEALVEDLAADLGVAGGGRVRDADRLADRLQRGPQLIGSGLVQGLTASREPGSGAGGWPRRISA